MPGPASPKPEKDYGSTPAYDPMNESASYNADRNKYGSDKADANQAANRDTFNKAAGEVGFKAGLRSISVP